MNQAFEKWYNESDTAFMSHTEVAESAWEAALQSQWQPIEVAPKTRIIVYCEEVIVCIAAFDGDTFYDDAGNELYGLTPTHWQPLPHPPQS